MKKYDAEKDASTVQSALGKYILADFMDGYSNLEDLIDSLENKPKYLVEEKDIDAFDRLYNYDPNKFVEIISSEWREMEACNINALLDYCHEQRCEHYCEDSEDKK
ncbi:hypothetical protein OIU41_11980 [Lacticaseibacillus paracasei]|uniref:hypothetical protein n=1 Tax=Lacticaseibacillus paracasei TaxID=1597 RepID=UPI00339090FF